jgi:hypothetical protein
VGRDEAAPAGLGCERKRKGVYQPAGAEASPALLRSFAGGSFRERAALLDDGPQSGSDILIPARM